MRKTAVSHLNTQFFHFHLFSDDSNRLYSDKDLQHFEETVNQELGEINTWLCANKLTLNIVKTHFVIFHPYQKNNLKLLYEN